MKRIPKGVRSLQMLLVHLFLLCSLQYSIICLSYRTRDNEEYNDPLPGRGDLLVNPEMDVQSEGMNFAFGTARRPVDDEPYVQMDANGEKLKLPKGIYHYSSHDTGADAAWQLPQEGQWWKGRAEVKDNFRNIDGIYLRHPLMKPINVQVITERRFEHGLDGSATDRSSSSAFDEARRVCAHDEGEDCERALNRYYELRAEEIAEANAPLHEQLAKLGDLASSTRLNSVNGHGLGMLLDLPGQDDPIYVGAALDRKRKENLNILFQPPRM